MARAGELEEMRPARPCCFFIAILLGSALAFATVFGGVRGLVHDPQHRPIQGAQITLKAADADWSRTALSNDQGEFQFDAIPAGRYFVTVVAPGFALQQQSIQVTSDNLAHPHFGLALASVSETVTVNESAETVNSESSTPSTVIGRDQIAHTPGADRTNSLAMITDYVPGAYVVHDQLHIRGGHQVEWLLDGVPVPNTSIATNVGPQFDPKDIDSIEVQRGGYAAEYGDRAYGVFNVVTRSGFERDHEGELVANYGSYNGTNDQLSIGSHTDRLAYYLSLSGNRTDLGLQTPSSQVLHDNAGGLGIFSSLIFNRTPDDQLRLVTALRGDHYQVPNDPAQQLAGVRDLEDERDAFVNFSWAHTVSRGVLLTISPFFHFNRAHYIGGPADPGVIPEDDRGSNYAGGVITLGVLRGRHNAHIGVQGFAERDNQFLGIQSSPDGAQNIGDIPITLRQRDLLWGGVSTLFLEDQFRVTDWLTFNGGVRLTHFSGSLAENAADPRVGAALRLPRLGWILRGFYGRYYQPPPLLTVSGSLLDVAAQQGFGFLPLRGERDEQHEVGVTIPIRGWALEVDHFRTAARNFFDHDALGNSNIFFPLTLARARIRGWEATLHSPRLAQRAQFHLAFSHQFVQGRGGVTGGLTDFQPPADNSYFYLDHDQRNTLSTGFQMDLPLRVWSAVDVTYGSGFLNGDGPAHLPAHTEVAVSMGRTFHERWTARFTATNLTNNQYLVDNSNTFGGTHYAYPRQLSVELRYRFKY